MRNIGLADIHFLDHRRARNRIWPRDGRPALVTFGTVDMRDGLGGLALGLTGMEACPSSIGGKPGPVIQSPAGFVNSSASSPTLNRVLRRQR